MSNQLEFEPAMSNFLDDGFSNAKGKRQEKKAARKEKRATKKEMKSVCGRKPLLKKKQGDWQKCVDESKAKGTAPAEETAAKTETTPTTETKDTTATTTAATTATTAETKADDKAAASVVSDAGDGGDSSDGKILGMSKPVFFIGLAVVAVGGFFAVRHFMGSKGASAPAVTS